MVCALTRDRRTADGAYTDQDGWADIKCWRTSVRIAANNQPQTLQFRFDEWKRNGEWLSLDLR